MLLVFIKFSQIVVSPLYLLIAWLIDCILFVFIGLFRYIYIYIFAALFFLNSYRETSWLSGWHAAFFLTAEHFRGGAAIMGSQRIDRTPHAGHVLLSFHQSIWQEPLSLNNASSTRTSRSNQDKTSIFLLMFLAPGILK